MLPFYFQELECGTDYTIYRAPVFTEIFPDQRGPQTSMRFHYFAVVWDADHDTRIFSRLDLLYRTNLLHYVQIAGERKGGVNLFVNAFIPTIDKLLIDKVFETGGIDGDGWCVDMDKEKAFHREAYERREFHAEEYEVRMSYLAQHIEDGRDVLRAKRALTGEDD